MYPAPARALRRLPEHLRHIFRLQVHAQTAQAERLVAIQQAGLHEQRHQVHHADILSLPFDVEGFGQAAYEELAGRIAGQCCLAVEGSTRRQIDHASTGGIAQIGVGGVAAEQHAMHIDADLAQVLRHTGLLERAGQHDAGVIHQQIQPAGVGVEVRQRIAPVFRARDVEPEAQAVLAAQLLLQCRHAVLIDIANADKPALLYEQARSGAADADSGTGDEQAGAGIERTGHGGIWARGLQGSPIKERPFTEIMPDGGCSAYRRFPVGAGHSVQCRNV